MITVTLRPTETAEFNIEIPEEHGETPAIFYQGQLFMFLMIENDVRFYVETPVYDASALPRA